MARAKKRKKESKLFRTVSSFLTETYQSSIWKFATFFLLVAFTGLTWIFTIPEQITKNSDNRNKAKESLEEYKTSRNYLLRAIDGSSDLQELQKKEADATENILAHRNNAAEWKPYLETLLATYTSAAELEEKLRTLQSEMRGVKFYSTNAAVLENEIAREIDDLEYALKELQIMAKKFAALKKGDSKALSQAIDERIALSPEVIEHLKTSNARAQSNLRAEEAALARATTETEAITRELEILQLKINLSYLCLAYILGYLISAAVQFRRTWKATK